MQHLAALGAAYGTAKSGTGIANMAVMHPELIMKSIIPVVMVSVMRAVYCMAALHFLLILRSSYVLTTLRVHLVHKICVALREH